jgi:flagellar motor switch protein FliM
MDTKGFKMAEELSKQEIDQLITVINAAPAVMETKRSNKFSAEQLQAVSYIHDVFANLTTCNLSAYMQSMCHVYVSSVDEFTYEEYLRIALFAPSTLAVVNMNPLKGSAILEINPEIKFAIIDRLCGGSGDGTKFRNELTKIETSIMNNVIVRMLDNLREAWNQILDIHPKVKTIDTNLISFHTISPNEIVILVTLATKIGETEGIITFCIPSSTIEPVMEKLTNWYWNKNQDNIQSVPLPTEKPLEERNRRISKKKFKPFARINRADPASLLNFLYNEHPQIIALVLAHMKPDKAAIILQNLCHDLQSDVFRRITVMDWVRDEITSEIERTIENMLNESSFKRNNSIAGGVVSAAKLLNFVDRASEKQILDDIEKKDPFLVEEIKKRQ